MDYSKSGDMESWLEGHGEEELAQKVVAIDKELGDTEYMNKLMAVFAPDEKPESSFRKPKFEECVSLVISDTKATYDRFDVELSFEILSSVDEKYEVKLESGWGIKGFKLNPIEYKEIKECLVSFSFRKRTGKEIGTLRILVDGNQIHVESIDMIGKRLSPQLPMTSEQDNKVELYRSQAGSIYECQVGSVSFEMVHVEGGTFRMGATEEQGEDAFDSENPVHQVTLSSYLIGKHEVTQALWEEVMGRNPSKNRQSRDYPVEMVSWFDCQEFIQKLNARTGMRFRLPTEAEWEYAARGGNRSKGYKYAGSDNLDEVGWYEDISDYHTYPVGLKKPNELGLYDMIGNVAEWCQDWYGKYSSEAQTNPTGPQSGGYRVLRGGSVWYDARFCRVSYRFYYDPGLRCVNFGLRLVLSL